MAGPVKGAENAGRGVHRWMRGELGNQGQNEKEHGISCNSKSFFTGGLSSRISAERKKAFRGSRRACRCQPGSGRRDGAHSAVPPRQRISCALLFCQGAAVPCAVTLPRRTHGCGWACTPFLFSLGEDGSSFRLIIVFWLCVYSLTPDLLSHSGAVLLASVT
jgi:hypothetical protein